MKSMSDVNLCKMRVMIREDFNVPLQDQQIRDDTRLKAALPTIKKAHEAGAAIILLSHLGRPEEGKNDPSLSLEPIAKRLSELLKHPVRFISNWLEGFEIQPGEIVLCENVRFNKGEKANDSGLSQKMAKLCDVFIMDAFATAHRAEASTCGVIECAPNTCMGLLFEAEIQALNSAFARPKPPVLAILGGSKVSTKLGVISALLNKVDRLILGGGIANTFLAAQNYPVGASLYEPNFLEECRKIIRLAEERNIALPLPKDVIVAETVSENASAHIKDIADVKENDRILDIGPQTIACYETEIKSAQTIIWNGPVGVFEFAPFSAGTRAIAQAIANSKAFSLAGGGDTLAAIEAFKVNQDISYCSTAGGALLEYLEGRELPAIAALNRRATKEVL